MKRKLKGRPLLRRLILLAMAASLAAGAQSGMIDQGLDRPAAEAAVWSGVRGRTALPDAATVGELVLPQAVDGLTVTPGGMAFGARFQTEGVTVVGFCDVETATGRVNPAAEAGLQLKDVILKVDGKPLVGAAQLTARIEACKGEELSLLCRRQKTEIELRLRPVLSNGGYKTGIWVRDSGAGIGTVTFFLPETGFFAGLGHGICDADTGELVSMHHGTVSGVTVSSVVKGTAGAPGELKGYFNPGKTGTLLGNTACGVWGVFSELPRAAADPIPIGLRDDMREGEAYILSTLSGNRIERYRVELGSIHRDAKGSKCFTVHVTDPALIARSGGIVQGMSGSPIIQNGKLVGAVTHVLINDPTTGYGIFIENMLNAVNIPMAKAS